MPRLVFPVKLQDNTLTVGTNSISLTTAKTCWVNPNSRSVTIFCKESKDGYLFHLDLFSIAKVNDCVKLLLEQTNIQFSLPGLERCDTDPESKYVCFTFANAKRANIFQTHYAPFLFDPRKFRIELNPERFQVVCTQQTNENVQTDQALEKLNSRFIHRLNLQEAYQFGGTCIQYFLTPTDMFYHDLTGKKKNV